MAVVLCHDVLLHSVPILARQNLSFLWLGSFRSCKPLHSLDLAHSDAPEVSPAMIAACRSPTHSFWQAASSSLSARGILDHSWPVELLSIILNRN
jgi:hypothetical protein